MSHQFGGYRFVERQTCAPWVWLIMAIIICSLVWAALSGSRGGGQGVLALPAVLLALIVNLLLMRTQVDDRQITVKFGWLFTMYARHIRLTQIESAESVTYSPLGEYGGWGIRGLGKKRALNMRGNRGVQLVLSSGERLLIGSQEPNELAEAIQAA